MAAMAPWILVVVSALLIGLLIILLVRLADLLGQAQILITARQALPEARVEVSNIQAVEGRIDSPLTRLLFRESLDPERFAGACTACANDRLTSALAARTADGMSIALQSVRLTQQGAELIVAASTEGRRLLREGKAVFSVHRATGERLPVPVDVDTGRTIEQLKEAQLASITSRLASISALAVGAAHLVAGADVAKRLARIEAKVDILLAARRIDQIARLERIYVAAQELALGAGAGTAGLEMWRLRGELRELRSAWRHELRMKLERIEDSKNEDGTSVS